jgi:ATP-dependent Lon protease
MLRPRRIPLFPLDVVLLPGTQLPLHIFEPRYKEMIARCINEKLEFGMILAASTAIASFGCTAEIAQKIKDYPDGRMDIQVEGRAAFQLTELLEEKEYYEGNVEYVVDDLSSLDAEKESQLIATFEQCHVLLYGRSWLNSAPDEASTLAFRMAGLAPMELEKRQALLEMPAERDRREYVLHWMNEFLPKLAGRQRARRRAGGNGHAAN